MYLSKREMAAENDGLSTGYRRLSPSVGGVRGYLVSKYRGGVPHWPLVTKEVPVLSDTCG